jgi:ankyrin repeat protein
MLHSTTENCLSLHADYSKHISGDRIQIQVDAFWRDVVRYTFDFGVQLVEVCEQQVIELTDRWKILNICTNSAAATSNSNRNMPKKSSKKASKAPTTTLVPHRAPQLANLLERAQRGKHSDVQQYLNAGGLPNVLVQVDLDGEGVCSAAPLLCGLVLSKHREAADSVTLLLQAGAVVDATFLDAAQEESTALLTASLRPGCLAILQALLDGGADPCYQTSDTGMSALHLAVIDGCASKCRALVAASSGRALELEL